MICIIFPKCYEFLKTNYTGNILAITSKVVSDWGDSRIDYYDLNTGAKLLTKFAKLPEAGKGAF